jgi:hypothetical protein
MSRIEEKTGLSVKDMGHLAAMHKRSMAPNQITPRGPLNKDGVRAPTGQNAPLNQNGKRNPNQTTPDSENSEGKQPTENNASDIESMTADKARWESELQGLEPQLKALNDRYKEDGVNYLKLQNVVTDKQKQGASKEEVDEARKSAADFLASTRGQADQMRQMQQKVDVLKNQIWSTNNKIIEEKYYKKKT